MPGWRIKCTLKCLNEVRKLEAWREELHDDLYLAHHGIKGQKWGIRRFQNPDGTLTEAGRKRYVKIAEKYGKEAGMYTGMGIVLQRDNGAFYDKQKQKLESGKLTVDQFNKKVATNAVRTGTMMRRADYGYHIMQQYKDMELKKFMGKMSADDEAKAKDIARQYRELKFLQRHDGAFLYNPSHPVQNLYRQGAKEDKKWKSYIDAKLAELDKK